jgi:hypothetical protein
LVTVPTPSPALEDDDAAACRQGDDTVIQRSVGDVGVVAGILDDAGRGMPPPSRLPRQRKARLFAPGQGDLDRIGKLTGEQGRERRFGGGRRAGPGGPAAAQRRGGFSIRISFSPASMSQFPVVFACCRYRVRLVRV